jgi:ligand-binding SRPBCC domain-containing protein
MSRHQDERTESVLFPRDGRGDRGAEASACMSPSSAGRTLHRRQWVPHPLETVFEFFERPENLVLITPPWLGLRLRTPGPLTMRAGLVIDYHVRVLGVTTRWRSLIADYDPPHAFCDVQVVGPYRRWSHRHRFHHEDGGTAIEDLIVYEPPLGPLGDVLDALVIRRQLAAIFEYRRVRIAALLGTGSAVSRR